MSSKAQLQEQLDLANEALADAKAEIADLKEDARKAIARQKEKVQKQADKLENERKAMYDEAKELYMQSLSVAKDIYKSFKGEAKANLGIVALGVREQVMHTLEQVFGDELEK